MSFESKLKLLNLILPPPATPKGVYHPVLINGNHAYVSGHGPILPDGTTVKGKVGAELDEERAKMAARHTGLAILASLQHKLGSLDRVKRVVKIFGMVNASPDFSRHPFIINGCSELFIEVFGTEYGVGARSAMGASGLPDNIAVEIEAIFELTEGV